MANPYFTENGLMFLRQLAQNNNREWFAEQKPVYEESVRTPALQFIADMADDGVDAGGEDLGGG